MTIDWSWKVKKDFGKKVDRRAVPDRTNGENDLILCFAKQVSSEDAGLLAYAGLLACVSQHHRAAGEIFEGKWY